MDLREMVAAITPLNDEWRQKARDRLNSLTKPAGSLGQLEEIAERMAGIFGRMETPVGPKAVIVMAGDHGVCEEGVSAYPQSVTQQMVLNFLQGGAAVNALARSAGADVVCVDMGIAADLSHPDLIVKKPTRGTANMSRGPAMAADEAKAAVLAGAETVKDLYNRGYRLFAVGEMGIGNSTAASAVLSALTGADPLLTVGRGTGVNDAGLAIKRAVVRRALEVNRPDPEDAMDVLAKVGGLELAGMAGVCLGAALCRVPVIIDGFISTAAALLAVKLAPDVREYLFASHLSQEPGHALLLKELGLKSPLQLDMRLGEGTGAVLCMSLLEASVRMMNEMATFESAGISGRSDETAADPGSVAT